MRLHDLIRTVALNLRRMRWRLALTVGAVVIGTSSVVLMMAIGAGMERSLSKELDSLGSATQISVYKSGDNPLGIPDTSGGPTRRLDDSAIRDLSEIEGVKVATGVHLLQVTATYKRYSTDLQLKVIDPRAMKDLGLDVASGRELRSGNEVVVGDMIPVLFLGEPFNDPSSAPRLDVLGKRIELELQPGMDSAVSEEGAEVKRMRARVAGVLAPGDFENDASGFVAESAARSAFGLRGRRLEYAQAIVKVADVDDVERVTAAIGEMGLEAMSMRAQVESVRKVFVIIQLVLGGIGGVALAVASLGIANTMTMSTYERTREIGIMKAVGASPRQIRRVFLGESGAIGLAGGLLGLAISAGIGALANLALANQLDGEALFYIPAWLAVFSVVFATIVGVLAGVLPAARAAGLDPLAALRHE